MDEDVMIYPKIAVRKSRWEAQKALSKAEGIFHSDWIRRALDAWEESRCCDGSTAEEAMEEEAKQS